MKDRLLKVLIVILSCALIVVISLVAYSRFVSEVSIGNVVYGLEDKTEVVKNKLDNSGKLNLYLSWISKTISSDKDKFSAANIETMVNAINLCVSTSIEDTYSCRLKFAKNLLDYSKYKNFSEFMDGYSVLKRAGVSRAMIPALKNVLEKQQGLTVRDNIWLINKISSIRLSFFEIDPVLKILSKSVKQASFVDLEESAKRNAHSVLLRAYMHKGDLTEASKHAQELLKFSINCSSSKVRLYDVFVQLEIAMLYVLSGKINQGLWLLQECISVKSIKNSQVSQRKLVWIKQRMSLILALSGEQSQAEYALKNFNELVNWNSRRQQLWNFLTRICVWKKGNKVDEAQGSIQAFRKKVNEERNLFSDSVIRVIESLEEQLKGRVSTFHTIFDNCFD